MMKNYTFAVVGALGTVGTEIRSILETSNLPIGNLILMDLAQNVAKKVSWRSNEYTVIEAKAESFTGVDIVKDKPKKWRVENSWGDKGGDKGYYLMTDKWFDQYNYEVVVDKKYLPKEILAIFDKEPQELPPWDPMGSLAK